MGKNTIEYSVETSSGVEKILGYIYLYDNND